MNSTGTLAWVGSIVTRTSQWRFGEVTKSLIGKSLIGKLLIGKLLISQSLISKLLIGNFYDFMALTSPQQEPFPTVCGSAPSGPCMAPRLRALAWLRALGSMHASTHLIYAHIHPQHPGCIGAARTADARLLRLLRAELNKKPTKFLGCPGNFTRSLEGTWL